MNEAPSVTGPRRPLLRGLLVVASLGLVASSAAIGTATAAPAPTPAPSASPGTELPNYDQSPGQQRYATWSLVPVDAKGRLDGRAKYAYTAAPGTTITDLMGVSNFSVKPLRLEVSATDATNTADGAFALLPVGATPTDLGRWITPKRSVVTVPARSRVSIPFSLRIPADATPGDHVAGIVATAVQSKTGNKTQQVAVNFRTGSRVYLRVTGALRPGLVVQNVHATYHRNGNPVGRGSATVTYRVANTGNVRLVARQSVSVTTPWGSRTGAAVLADVPELLPGAHVDFRVSVPGVLPAVLLKATVDLEPAGPRGVSVPAVSPVHGEVRFWAVPWLLIAIVVGLVAAWLVRLWRRRGTRNRPPGRRRRNGPPPPRGGGSSDVNLTHAEQISMTGAGTP